MAKRKATKQLGRLQKAILKCLRRNGAAMLSSSLAWEIHNADRDEHESWEEPSHSLDVSVRRAIHALAKRGLVCVGVPSSDFGGRIGIDREPRHGCVCWLPKHDAPPVVETVPGQGVEAVVLAELEAADGEWIDYTELRKEVMRQIEPEFYGFVDGWAAVAVSRAVRRLVRGRVVEGQAKNSRLDLKRVRAKREG